LKRLLAVTDPELAAHGRRTARLAMDVAEQMGVSRRSRRLLEVGAELHDIGKLFISNAILQHPGPLTEEQWVGLRHHPAIGYELVTGRVPDPVAEMVLTHHERFDGSGYPNAVTGRDIPFESRILQVADAFDAITSNRPYQAAQPVSYAVAEMIRCIETQFDPGPVRAILALAGHDAWRTARFGHAGALAEEIAV
jgi:HD-GYP domain-containing protein (c-di-GMP phosphodiesterase class II)